MPLSQPFRKFTLLAHVLSSVGWAGAVAAFLALAVTGLNSPSPVVVRAVYIAMPSITTWIIVPLAILSLLTGLVLSICTPWGLLRHYWIIFKLLISAASLPLLFLHTSIIRRVATAASDITLPFTSLHEDRQQLVVASAASLAALVAAALLSVYKPRGRTACSW